MKFTIFGSNGFVGQNLCDYLVNEGHEVIEVSRNEPLNTIESLGHVFYCIGLTANFRTKPYETVEAHVCLLKKLLESCSFESLTYLSSTRLYKGVADTSEESPLMVLPSDPDYIYNISKLLGESLCMSSGKKVKIVRLSNVFGKSMSNDTFLYQVLSEGLRLGEIKFLTSALSSKDYISIEDVVHWLPKIALSGKYNLYNIGSGINTSNEEISMFLNENGISTLFDNNAETISFKTINTKRINEEFGYPQSTLKSYLPTLLSSFKSMRKYI